MQCGVSDRQLHHIVKVKKKKKRGGRRELTESVGGIHGKEKTSETDAVRNRCSAVYVEGLRSGNIVQGRKHILCTERLSSADCGHNLFCKSATYGDL